MFDKGYPSVQAGVSLPAVSESRCHPVPQAGALMWLSCQWCKQQGLHRHLQVSADTQNILEAAGGRMKDLGGLSHLVIQGVHPGPASDQACERAQQGQTCQGDPA